MSSLLGLGVTERSNSKNSSCHPWGRLTNCHATYLIGHVMSGRAVHVVVAPLEEVVLYDLQVLAGVSELELVLGQARCLSGTHKG